MSSTPEKLQATLRELELELASLGSLDAEGRKLLTQAMVAIRTKLDAPSASTPEPALLEQVHTAARDFEATHPDLSAVLKRIAEGLAQLGI